jgi:acetyl-CoA synthetase
MIMINFEIKNLKEYHENYSEAVDNPEVFWATIAKENFTWKRPWSQVLDWDFSIPKVSWFEGAQLNITENCIDRHLSITGNKTAILFEPNNPNDPSEAISYKELHKRVNQFANVLKSKGIQKGDRVCIYLPMIPELAISVLACARICCFCRVFGKCLINTYQ